MTILVRERPPLRLHATISTPAGGYYAWSPDAHLPSRAMSGLSFSTAMPGGFDQANLVLTRDPSFDYNDLQELSTVTIRGAGGRTVWEGRMETAPRTSGDQMSISPGLVGWQAHLSDNASARQIYCDIDLSNWLGASAQRKINLTNAKIDEDDGSSGPDWTTSKPALVTGWGSSWTRAHVSELWYDAKGLPIKTVNFTTNNPPDNVGAYVINPGDANWNYVAILATDDVATAYNSTANLLTAGVRTGTISAPDSSRKWALLQLIYNPAAGNDGVNYAIYWTQMVVLGVHTVPYVIPAGVSDVTFCGMLASSLEVDILRNWAPRLAFTTTGASPSIRPSTFLIPQVRWLDMTTPAAMVKEVNQYELRDWAVWEGPTYYSNAFNARGRFWQARVRTSQLSDTGPQASRLFNGVVVTYTDVTGVSRSVGPVGSGAAVTDAGLSDPDPLNPVNELGIRKWAQLSMQTSVAAAAIQVGTRFLQYQKLLNTAGQATLVGHVQDMNGNWWPTDTVRAGDQISFVDANDFSFRRIVSTSFDDTSKTNTIQLDSPPDGMQALLERFAAQLTPSGFS
jgi:hypothetical protein